MYIIFIIALVLFFYNYILVFSDFNMNIIISTTIISVLIVILKR